MRYHVRPGIHHCVAGGKIVLLDQEADRYLGLDSNLGAVFEAVVENKDIAIGHKKSVDLLLKRKIVEPGDGSPSVPPASMAPRLEATYESDCQARGRDILDAGRYLSMVYFCLRFRSFNHLVRSLRRRGDRKPAARHGAETEIVQRIVAAHRAFGYLLTAHDRCLPHSAAMLAHLASSGVRAHLVIGVIVAPFSAHCWVQWGSWVLNDQAEHAAMYTPILVV